MEYTSYTQLNLYESEIFLSPPVPENGQNFNTPQESDNFLIRSAGALEILLIPDEPRAGGRASRSN